MARTKKMNKTLDAENVMLLRHLLDMEISAIREETGVDMVFFSGVDGRMFSSDVPTDLTVEQFRMFNLSKANLPYLCSQLKNQDLIFSLNKYKEGGMVVSGVGSNAFLSLVTARDIDMDEYQKIIKRAVTGSMVVHHIFELKPISESLLAELPEDARDELLTLSRRLFVERFEDTREYKKNMEILTFIKKKIEEVAGIGVVEEITTLVFNEMGTTAPYMDSRLWALFTEKVIQDHIKLKEGDVVADELMKTWVPEVERKIKSFV